MRSLSPLRYPGGKQILARVLARLIQLNGCEGGVYAEAFAGGAGAALSLLFSEYVSRIILNDADRSIYAFWRAILDRTEDFLKLLRDTPITVAEWERQRSVYLLNEEDEEGLLGLGFAAFYLNRCNRSGIIGNAGPIGGRAQSGEWGIDARFNRRTLAARIERIAAYRERISVFNVDALDFLRDHVAVAGEAYQVLVYLDPPYYVKGSDLYLNYYRPEDHRRLAAFLMEPQPFFWVMSYDDVPEIRCLYRGYRQVTFRLGYSARESRLGNEVLISNREVEFPAGWKRRLPGGSITTACEIAST